MIVALAGGVGGARMAQGLASILPPDELLIVVNTGDDFTHLGLRISPDLDTVMYTLAGVNNAETGWGRAGESWNFLHALGELGGETWFRLGDRDLATHVIRTGQLSEGRSLSEVTQALCAALGVRHRLVPMTDAEVRTVVHTDEGVLSFQDYFVRRQCEPKVKAVEFDGTAHSPPSPAFAAALRDPGLRAVVICPSNPYLSVQPILCLRGLRAALAELAAPVIAVSPLVGGRAVKGPAAKIMEELGATPSAREIARFYRGLADGLVIDSRDRGQGAGIMELGMRVCATDTLMSTPQHAARLARATLDFAAGTSRAAG